MPEIRAWPGMPSLALEFELTISFAQESEQGFPRSADVTLGLISGSGQSGSNRALRTIGGAAAGRGVGNLAVRSQAFEYTVSIGGRSTIRVVFDQAGKRVGDCVAVEQGQFASIRLVPESRCAPLSFTIGWT